MTALLMALSAMAGLVVGVSLTWWRLHQSLHAMRARVDRAETESERLRDGIAAHTGRRKAWQLGQVTSFDIGRGRAA